MYIEQFYIIIVVLRTKIMTGPRALEIFEPAPSVCMNGPVLFLLTYFEYVYVVLSHMKSNQTNSDTN